MAGYRLALGKMALVNGSRLCTPVKELVPSRDESTESKMFTRESNLLLSHNHPLTPREG